MPQIPHTDYNEAIAGYWEWEIGKDSIAIDASLSMLLGYDPGALPNTLSALKRLVVPKSLELLRAKFKAHVNSHGKRAFVQEAGLFHREGHVICVLLSGKITAWDRQAKVAKMSGSYLDITPHRQAEKELQRVKEFLNRTNQVAMVGGWELDMETDKVIWTQVTKSIFEVPEDYVPQRGLILSFFNEEADAERLKKAFQDAVTKGMDYDLELKMTTAKGREIWTRTVGHPEFEDGKCVRLYGVFQNIDAHKTNQEALRVKQRQAEVAAEAKLEFLSTMSHEIRTPMNAVIGFTNLLLQNPREDQLEYLNVLKFSADNLLTLINDILDFNKIDAGKIELERTDFDIRQLVNNIYAAQQQDADRKGLQLALHIDTRVPQHLVGDPVRLGQVITNLVANAIKFTPQGRVEVTISLVEESGHTVRLYFEVRDTGIGIPKEKHDQIFEAFSQASSETTRKYGGTGLGLSICKKLLELVGSRLLVDSTVGDGTLFFFELNFKKGRSLAGGSDQKPLIPASGFPGKKVLITEDNPVNVLVIRKFLKQWQIESELAENGKIALEMVKHRHYDLILMDLQMPEMDGYDAAKAIRQLPDARFKEMPIIALTASAVSDMRARILASGMNDCVTKPFKPAVLHEVLAGYLR
jgi:signal transduction histidine kinase